MKINIADLELTEDCRRCDGMGKRYFPDIETCPDCNGGGEQLSYNGEALIAFLRRYVPELYQE